MNSPNELAHGPLPDDLKVLLQELKVPQDDPILPLLGWLWGQMNQTGHTVADARMAFMAALDTRLEKITASAELIGRVQQQMEQTKNAMDALQTGIARRVDSELMAPIEASMASARFLAASLNRLLHQTTDVLAHARRRQMIAILAAGLVTGILTGLCLSSLGFLRH